MTVINPGGGGGGGAVSSVFTRTGAVTAQAGDYAVAQVTGAAPLASPTFTGTPAAPTAPAGTSTTQLATTAFVTGALATPLELAGTTDAKQLIVKGFSTQTNKIFEVENSSGTPLFNVDSSGNVLVGIASSQSSLTVNGNNSNAILNGGSQAGSLTLNAGQIGVYGNSPNLASAYLGPTAALGWNSSGQIKFFAGSGFVSQQSTTGTTAGFTAGAGTAMNSASTSTGGSGASAYTFGDLVLALKNYGLLAA